jgi:hypothetical protein
MRLGITLYCLAHCCDFPPLNGIAAAPGRQRCCFRVAAVIAALLLATHADAAALTLQWDPPSDRQTSGYVVLYGTAPGRYTARRDVGFVTRVHVGDLLPGTRYCFAIQAYNAPGEVSEPSTEVCGATAGAPPPNVPPVVPPPPPTSPQPGRGAPRPHESPGTVVPHPNRVDAVPCVGAPHAPLNLQSRLVNGRVMLTWTPARDGCAARAFTVLAGRRPWQADLRSANVTTSSASLEAPPGTYYVFIQAHNAFGTSIASNLLTVAVGRAGVQAPTSARTERLRVGIDVAPSRYFTDPKPGCRFDRERGAGGPDLEILAFDAAQWITDVLPSDLTIASSPDCGTWSQVPSHGPQQAVVAGTWLVGPQIVAGTYYAYVGPGCYWARLREFSADGVVENEFYEEPAVAFVTLDGTDVGFQTDGDCGTWIPINTAAALHLRATRNGSSPAEIAWRRQQNLEQEMRRLRTP